MADKIGRVFIEVGADVSQLNARFNEAISKIQDADGKFADMGKRMSKTVDNALNPTLRLGNQITALGKAGVTAADQVRYFGERLDKAIETATRNGRQIDPVVANLVKMRDEMNRAAKSTQGWGESVRGIGQGITEFARNPLQAMQSGVTDILEKMGPFAVGFAGIATAAGFAGKALFDFVNSASDAFEQLENLSATTGISVDRLGALQEIAKEAGLGGLDLGRVISKLNEELGKPEAQTFEKGIEALGIGLKDLSTGAPKDALTLLSEFGEYLKAIPDPAERAQVGVALLGNRSRDLIALLVRLNGTLLENVEAMEKSTAYSEKTKESLRGWDSLMDSISKKTVEIKVGFMEFIGGIYEAISGFIKSEPFIRFVSFMQGNYALALAGGSIAPQKSYKDLFEMPRPEGVTPTANAVKILEDQKRLEEERKKRIKETADALEKAQQVELKYLQEQLRSEEKVKDQAGFYADEVEKAAKAWEKNVAELKRMDPLMNATMDWAKSWVAVAQMKPRPLFEETPGGQTFEDFKNSLPAINKEIDTFVAKNERASENVTEVWRRQVSTIVTDWSRGIADILVEGGNFGQKLTDIFKETAKSILRMLIEQLFNPLKNLFSKIFGGMTSGATGGAGFLGSLGGIFGTAAGSIATGGLLGAIIPQTPSSKVLGGIAGGIGGVAGYGAFMGATSAAGPLAGMTAALASIPVWGWAALGATAIGTILYKMFTKSSVEAGAMEAARDLGGINIGESTIKSFYSGLGLGDKQSYGIRKDLLTSPLFISQIAVPAAQSQGRLDALLKDLEKISVDSRIAASGFLNFRAAVEQGIKTGDWSELNKQYEAAFKNSTALTSVMPDFASKLAAMATTASDAADATTGLSDGMQGLLDSIVSAMPAVDDMYATFFKTGEILPELAADIQKYGGSLEVFQRYASLGGLRENLTAIGNLISGLSEILPDLDPIQKLLSGGGIDWGGLQAMGLDPSKLIGMADLVAFESRWEESVRQFQDTGRLLSGSVLQQALWKFGGAAGATALSRWDQGFNTITPGLLDATKSAMDIAYKTERETAMDYLKGVQSSMESEIQAATDAIVTELKNILAAIQTGGTATPAAAVTSQGGAYIDMRGATVYGYEDFEDKVQTAWTTAHRRGAFSYAVP